MTDRPYSRKLTRELAAMANVPDLDSKTLHAIYVELIFRERKAARALRAELEERLNKLEYFKWPSTKAAPGKGGMGTAYFQYRQGPLGYLGYRVGHSGATSAKRQELLSSSYSGDLPPINGPRYMAKWGEPAKASRLKQMATFIAQLVRNAKRNDATRYKAAIIDWVADLAYLKRAFYDGKYDYNFKWPRT